MSELTKIQRIHLLLSIGASIVAIASAAISVAAYMRVDAFQKLYVDTRALEMQLSITKPAIGADVSTSLISWSGHVQIHSSSRVSSGNNVTLELAERGIRIYPFVRPLSSANLWWAQSAATLDLNGELSGQLNLGDESGSGVGFDYQMVLVAIPAGAVTQGQTFADLPQGSAQSSVITIHRSK